MKRKKYSAGAVKVSFWFMEFKKTAQLINEGHTLNDIRKLNEEANIYGAPTEERKKQIFSTVSARIKSMDPSFVPLFAASDLKTQKLIALSAVLANDTLFFDFVYEVIREKMILGIDEITDRDISVFFKNKQEQSEIVAKWKDYTLHRLGASYKTHLFEAGFLDNNQRSEVRKIYKPILDIEFEHWLEDHNMKEMINALTGVR